MTQSTATPIDREYIEAVSKVFESFALEDQRNYYIAKMGRSDDAGNEVNLLRAASSLTAGLASALAALLVALNIGSGAQCDANSMVAMCLIVLPFLAVTSVVAPSVGAAFGTLGDLYQWDRLVSIYETALKNLEVADALSPQPGYDDDRYWLSVRSFAEGTLAVMADETSQWGTQIRTPQQIERFMQESEVRANRTNPAAYPRATPVDASEEIQPGGSTIPPQS